jgi:hypothetical protein
LTAASSATASSAGAATSSVAGAAVSVFSCAKTLAEPKVNMATDNIKNNFFITVFNKLII